MIVFAASKLPVDCFLLFNSEVWALPAVQFAIKFTSKRRFEVYAVFALKTSETSSSPMQSYIHSPHLVIYTLSLQNDRLLCNVLSYLLVKSTSVVLF